MSKNSTPKSARAASRKAAAPPRRRTRMIALEPRMLFDGALGLDLGTKATALVAGTDSSHAGDVTAAPAAPEAPKDSTATTASTISAPASATPAEKDVLQRPGAEALDAAGVQSGKEIVFVDSRVKDYQSQLAGVSPNARLVFLDASKDGITQIADAMAAYSDVTAIHIVAQGSADQLLLGSTSLDAQAMQGLGAQRLSSISEHITADATILVHGADFGKGDAGGLAADRLALLTSADVADVHGDGTVEKVGVPARQEIVFVDPTVRDFQTLVDGIDNPNARVVLLDSTKDGVQQIAEVVGQYQRIDAIHVISHGSEGQIDIGASALNGITMSSTYAAQLAEIGKHLSADADLLVYGCDFGKGADGAAAADKLAQLTGADVAASTDATGHADLGGDWNLELKTGSIESAVAIDRLAQEAWHDKLSVYTLDWDTLTWPSGSSQTYNVGNGTVTITTTTGAPTVDNTSYTGGLSPSQNSLVFAMTGTMTVTIDFSGQVGGSVSNVGFALFDVDNAESAVVSAIVNGVSVAPTNVATSLRNTATIGATSATVSGTGSDSTSTQANGNAYFYFNTNNITQVSFTYSSAAFANVVLNDITFMGNKLNPPVVDLDAASGAVGAATDGFATQAYSGSSGTIPWGGDWTESDSAGGGATGGNVRVIDAPTAGTDYALRLNNSSTASSYNGASRAIDLSGYTSLSLTYDYMTSAGLSSSDQVALEISTNGGQNFTMLKSYSGSSASATGYTSETVSLAGYESANTVIRFRVTSAGGYTGAGEYFYVDNVQITAQATDSSNTYTEGDTTGVLIAGTADSLITDPDSTDMSSAKIQINNVAAGDVLTWTAAGSITGSYDAATGILSLTGVDTKANYQAVLNSVRYMSTANDLTAGGTRTSVDVAVSVIDSGFNESNTAKSAIALVAVNDAPVNSVPAQQYALVDSPLVFSTSNGNAISVSDVEGGNVEVTLSATNGTLSLSGTGGLTFSAGDGTADATMTFTGTQADVNSALSGLSFTPVAGFTGAASLAVTTNDLGNAGIGGPLADTDSVAIAVVPNNILDLDSTPSVAVSSASPTSDLASNGDMSTVSGGVPTGWTEGGTTSVGAANSGRYAWTNASTNTGSTLSQAITLPVDGTTTAYSSNGSQLVQTTTVTTNAVTGVAFDYVWQNSDTGGGANNNVLEVRYNGVLYATFTTGRGNNTTGTWTYSNGATGTEASGIVAQGSVTTGTLSTNTITFGTPVTSSGDLSFTFGKGPSGNGSDRVAIDNVRVTNTASSAITTTTVDLANNGWTTTYTENGSPVAIADTDSSIFDVSSVNMQSASITLTNAQTGDRLLVNGSTAASGTLASGISWTRTATTVTLSGAFSKADYADAIELVQFENTTDDPSTAARTVAVTVSDGTTTSNTAIATINVLAVDDAPIVTSGTSATVAEGIAAGTAVYTATATDPDGPAITYSLSGADAGAFSIDSSTGVVTINASPNYEAKSSYSFNVVASDGSLSDSKAVTLSITDVAPTITSATSVTVPEGTSTATVVYTAAATDPAGGAVSFSLSGADAGAFTIDGTTGAVTFNASPDYETKSAYSFSVVASDGTTTSSQAVTVSVTAVNDNDPVFTSASSFTVADSATAAGTVSATDADLPAQTLTYGIVGGADAARFVIDAGTGALSFVAPANFSAPADADGNNIYLVQVQVSDGSRTTLQNISVRVNPGNAPVNAVPGGQGVSEDAALVFSSGGGNALTVADSDTGVLTVTLTVSNGTASLSSVAGLTFISGDGSADGTMQFSGTIADINAALDGLTYSPSPDYNGPATLSITSDDGTSTDTKTVAIAVSPVNDAPVASNANVAMNEDGTLNGTLPVATDVDLDALSYTKVSDPANGTVTVNADGTYTYTPAANFNGSDSFTYKVNDGTVDSAVATVTVTVNPVNDAPVAADAAVAVNEDTALNGTLPAATDADLDALTYVKVSDPANGTVTVNADGTYTYTPSANFNGTDSFTYKVNDGTADSAVRTVTITVAAVNDAPIASNAAVSVNEDTSLSGTLPVATDADLDALSYIKVSDPANGAVTVNADGTYTYTPAADFNGTDSFTYKVNDGTADSAVRTVTITVIPVNDAPSAASMAVAVNEDTVLNGTLPVGTDVDLDALTYVKVSDPSSGTVTINADGTYTYTPSANFNGSDSFTYKVNDGTADSAVATVTITVLPVDDAPVAAPIVSQTATPGVPFNFTLPAGAFSDVDTAVLAFSAAQANGSALPGWLNFDPTTGSFSGTPPAGFGGVDIKVTASDGSSSASGVFSVNASVSTPAAAATIPATPTLPVPAQTGVGAGGSVGGADVGAGSLPAFGATATSPSFDSMALREPVDSSVPASHFGTSAPAAGSTVAAPFDLNALPPTGAGPSEAFGFPVWRVTQDEASAAMRVSDGGLAISGQRLFVYHGIPSMELSGDGIGSARVPADAFAHTDPKAVVQLEARLINGSSLPGWLQFGGTSGVFRGLPPDGLTGTLDIEVIARDDEGREARTTFSLRVEALRAAADAQRAQETPDIMLGLDVDAKEREKARLEAAQRAQARAGEGTKPGAGGKLQKEPAASFTDQVRAAKKARDPLLDKIVRSEPNGRGPRR